VDGQAPHLRRAVFWLALTFVSVLASPAAGGFTAHSAKLGELRTRSTQIAAARRSALLNLYALDSRVAATGARLGELNARAAEIRSRRAETGAELAAARAGLTAAEQRLGDQLRVLYEQGDVTPLDVFLGAGSLDDALTALDTMDRAATQDRRVLEQLRDARSALVSLDRTLAAEEAAVEHLGAEAAATTGSLDRARAERNAYLGRLARRQATTTRELASLEARAAGARARAVVATRAVAAPAAAATSASGVRTLTVDAVAYSLPGRTYIGLPVGPGVVAVDPSVIPLGTRMTIPGYGEGIAADIGTAVKGTIIDLWFPTLDQARAWGRRTVTITLHG
jgi:3D (Asp-Asp-Asp) domain-containing protein